MVREITPVEELFEERYQEFLRMANKITKFDTELSHDLLHEVFVNLRQRGLVEAPRNVNGYMYIVLRNSYQSILRKKRTENEFVLYDDELITEATFEPNYPRDQIADEYLRIVCRYASSRRLSSISGSIVLLRYFHGFNSREVTKLIRRSRNAVDARLAAARREMKLFFEDPAAIRALQSYPTPAFSRKRRAESGQDVILLSRREIFANPVGHCLTDDDLQFVYRINKKPPGHKLIGHVVSCESCLKRVQKLLRIPDEGDRHPLDSIRDGLLGAIIFLTPLIVKAIDSFQMMTALSMVFVVLIVGSA